MRVHTMRAYVLPPQATLMLHYTPNRRHRVIVAYSLLTGKLRTYARREGWRQREPALNRARRRAKSEAKELVRWLRTEIQDEHLVLLVLGQ